MVAQIRPGMLLRNIVKDIPTTVFADGGRIGVNLAVAAVVGVGEKREDRIELVKENHAVFLQKEGERQT